MPLRDDPARRDPIAAQHVVKFLLAQHQLVMRFFSPAAVVG